MTDITTATLAGKLMKVPPVALVTIWPRETQVTVGEHRSTITGKPEAAAWLAIRFAADHGSDTLQVRIENVDD
jgi:hypothetical protein